jgi:hypothetical protein
VSLDLFETELFAPLLVDSDGVIRRAGKGWPLLFGFSVDSLEGSPLVGLAAPEHAERIDRALAKLATGAPSAVVQVRASRPGDARRLVLRMAAADNGAWLVVAEDITVRNTVMEGMGSFRSLVDYTTDSWIVHDLAGRIRDVNPWACTSLSYTREELLELHIADIEMTIKPGRLGGVWNRMGIGRPLTVEGRHRAKDGLNFPVEVRLVLFQTDSDEVLMLAVARDISARKQQERHINDVNVQLQGMTERLSEEVEARTAELDAALGRLSTTVTQLVDGLCTISPEGVITLANPAMSRLLGIADPTGALANAVLPRAICAAVLACLDASQHHAADVPMPGERSGRATASSLGEGLGVVVLLRDITLEREVDRMKTDFIATVSHELRTPLTSVLGFAKIMRSRLEKNVFPEVDSENRRAMRAVEQVRDHIDIVLSEGDRLTALINDVLDISKMEAGRMEWRLDPFDPIEVAQKAIASVESLFLPGGPMLILDVPTSLPVMQGDANRLQQVLINLLSNAAKFTEDGEVELGARLLEDAIEYWVRDTGGGIPEDLCDQVFDKFRQVGDTLTNKPAGTGLGLPICRQIVTAHGGEISVRSRLGDGAVFRITIPLVHPTLS